MMKLIELISNSKPRSTVLRPFYWMMAFLFTSICTCIFNKSYGWVLDVSLVFFVIIIIAFLVAYFICLSKNPDHLRSENYNINKLEIEKYAASSSKNKT